MSSFYFVSDDKENSHMNVHDKNEIDLKCRTGVHALPLPRQKPKFEKSSVRFALSPVRSSGSKEQEVFSITPTNEKLIEETPTRTKHAGRTPRFIKDDDNTESPLLDNQYDTTNLHNIRLINTISGSEEYDFLVDNLNGICAPLPMTVAPTEIVNLSDSFNSLKWNISPASPNAETDAVVAALSSSIVVDSEWIDGHTSTANAGMSFLSSPDGSDGSLSGSKIHIRRPMRSFSTMQSRPQSSAHNDNFHDVNTPFNQPRSSHTHQTISESDKSIDHQSVNWDNLQGLLGLVALTNNNPSSQTSNNAPTMNHEPSSTTEMTSSKTVQQFFIVQNGQKFTITAEPITHSTTCDTVDDVTPAAPLAPPSSTIVDERHLQVKPASKSQLCVSLPTPVSELYPKTSGPPRLNVPANRMSQAYPMSYNAEMRLPVTKAWDSFVQIRHSAEAPVVSPSKLEGRTLRRTMSFSDLTDAIDNNSQPSSVGNSQVQKSMTSECRPRITQDTGRGVGVEIENGCVPRGYMELASELSQGMPAGEAGGVSTCRPKLRRPSNRVSAKGTVNVSDLRWQDDCPAAFPPRKEMHPDGCVARSTEPYSEVPVIPELHSTVPRGIALCNSSSSNASEITVEQNDEHIQTESVNEADAHILSLSESCCTGEQEMIAEQCEDKMVDVSIQCCSLLFSGDEENDLSVMKPLQPPTDTTLFQRSVLSINQTYFSSDDEDENPEVAAEVALEDLVGSPDTWDQSKPQKDTMTGNTSTPVKPEDRHSDSSRSSGCSKTLTGSRPSRLGSATRLRLSEVHSDDDDDDDGNGCDDQDMGQHEMRNVSIQMSEEQLECDDVPENDSLATTLTLEQDQSMTSASYFEQYGTSPSPNARAIDRPPRLVAAPRRTKPEGMDDVKELTIQGRVGVCTTISLKFGNRKSKPQELTTRAIQMRYDAYDGYRAGATADDRNSQDCEITNTFNCSPSQVVVTPGDVAVLSISFTPDRLGIFSGALKIKSTKKSFVILLRGEAVEDAPQSPSILEESKVGLSIQSDGVHADNYTEKSLSMISKKSVKKRKDKDYSSEKKSEGQERTTSRSQSERQNGSKRSVHEKTDEIPVIPTQLESDPLVLGQKWTRSWLARTAKKGAMGLAVDNVEAIQLVKSGNGGSSVSVMPHTLVLSPPLAVPEDLQRDQRKGLQQPLEGALFVRNFSDTDISFTATTSSAFLRLRCKSTLVASHDDASILVRYEGPPDVGRLQESHHYGYILISTSNGSEFVVEVRLGASSQPTAEAQVPQQSKSKMQTKQEKTVKQSVGSRVVNPPVQSDQEQVSVLPSSQQQTTQTKSVPQTKANQSDAVAMSLDQSENDLHSRRSNSHSYSQSISQTMSLAKSESISPSHELVLQRQSGIYFRKSSVDFGSVAVGSLSRMKIELCNSTDKDVIVLVGDPALPFVILHNEVRLRARSYVRVPVRFLPVMATEFSSTLQAQTDDGGYQFRIALRGTSY